MQILELKRFQCKFLAKVISCEVLPTNCIESLDETIAGLTKEMVLKQWLDRVYEFFIGMNSMTLKDREGQFVETLEQFLDSPDVVFKMNQSDQSLALKIEMKKDSSYWYELYVEESQSITTP